MERVQDVLFQDLKNDSGMGIEEAISDPDSTTNKGDPQSQRQKEEPKLLLAYQETSQQQEKRRKNYCLPTKRRVSSKKNKEKLLLAYQETSQQQEKRKKRAAQVQKTRVVDVCLKAAHKKPDSEVTGPCS